VIILGIIQGATEFIPVSSSGHLVLVPWLLNWPQPTLLFDTMLHWGTLLAVVVYFWRDWWAIITAWLRGLVHWNWSDPNARLAWWIVAASIPAAVAGILLKDFFEAIFQKPVWAAVFLLITALILVIGERLGHRTRDLTGLNWLDALLIGVAQAVSILPGISRSGSTISAGMVRDLDRPSAARFSFLLGTPAILGAGLIQLKDLFGMPNLSGELALVAVGLITAALVGYLVIWGLMRYLQGHSLYVFAAYCAVVGVLCLLIAAVRG
jgi:undecaprenyl-diphosphatase